MTHTNSTGYPLSAGQYGIWLAIQLGSSSELMNWGEYLQLDGALDEDAFVAAVGGAVAETDALNVRFTMDETGEPRQFPVEREVPLTIIDLRGATDPHAEAEAFMRADVGAPVDLEADVPYREVLFRIADDRHYWYWRMHHIVMDGFGHSLFVRRVAELYTARRTGRREPERSFLGMADLLADEARYLDSDEHTADRTYWMDRFADHPAPVTLTSRYASPSTEVLRDSVWLPAGEFDRLRALADACAVRWSRVLIALFAGYLHRVTQRQDIIMSLAVTGRAPGVSRRVPAMMSKVLPLRLHVAADMSLAELVRQVADEVSGLAAHQRYPVESLRRGLALPGAAATTFFGPLLNIMRFDQAAEFEGCTAELRHFMTGRVEDMQVVADHRSGGDGLRLDVDLNPGSFGAAELATHRDALLTYLTGALDGGLEARVGDLPLLDRETERRTLERTSGREPGRGVTDTVCAMFDAQVRARPEAVALVADGTRVTYAELGRRANQIAHRLLRAGVRPGAVVGVHLDRGPGAVAALLAVLKAGAAYTLMDPSFPAARHLAVDARTVVSDAVLAERLDAAEPGRFRLVLLDTEAAAIAGLPCTAPEVEITAEDRACVMYTSGSTGAPKGVVSPHRALVGTYVGQDYVDFGPHHTWLQLSPMAWDAFGLELFGALLHGGTCVLMPGNRVDMGDLVELTRRHAVTVLQLSAGLFNLLVDEHPEVFASLRIAMTAGEAASAGHVARIGCRFPNLTLLNGYGPAESMGFTTFHRLTGKPENGPVPIGKLLVGKRGYVLDHCLRPVPPGVLGELYVSGIGLAHGYAGQPVLTAARFVADPFERGGTMYRTGDLVRLSPDGVLEFAGRADEQVKVRGFRVELSEVERALSAVRHVRHCLAMAVPDELDGHRLVGYVVGPDFDADGARRELAERVPEYLVPSDFVVLPHFPLTANGKIDRRALPVPERSRPSAGFRQPDTPQEEIVAGLAAEILGVPAIGVDDDFFAAGGHSLSAMRLLSRVHAVLGRSMGIRDFFQAPTVAGICRLLTDDAPRLAPLVAVERSGPEPLSYAQRRLWLLDQVEGVGNTYNIPIALRLSGAVDAGCLAVALRDVLGRHQVLRTVVDPADGVPTQRVIASEDVGHVLTEQDVSAETLDEVLDAAAATVFDLERDIPVRAWLLRVTPADHVLLVVIHHIAADGWSTGPLLRDLWTAYDARTAGAEPGWEPLPVQYADYAAWQRRCLGDAADPDSLAATQLDYWTKQLDGLPASLDLPFDRSRPPVAGHRGGRVPLELDAELHARLVELARERHSTLFMVLHAGLSMLLSALGAGDDIPVGTPIAGRGHRALEDSVGFFVNTLVLRTDVSGDPTFAELVDRVRDADLAAYEHQDLPFDQLVEVLNPVRSTAHHPLFQVMLAVDNTVLQPRDAEPAVAPHPLEIPTAKFDLAFAVRPRYDAQGAPARIEGDLEFTHDLFDQDTATDIVTRFVLLLDRLTARPDHPVTSVSTLSDAEEAELRGEWERAERDRHPGELVHLLFERHARATPGALALVDGDAELTYAELDDAANRLAHRLARAGARPGRLVAIALPGSASWVTGLLAVLKTGAAFLPVDPLYPAERIRYMLADAAPTVLLTAAEWLERLPGTEELATVVVDGDEPDTTPAKVGPLPAAGCTVEDRAYVIYTSGSTGRPKGVVIPHAGIADIVGTQITRLAVGPGSRVLQLASASFDAALWDVFGALLSGATLVLAPRKRPLGQELAEFVARQGVTHAALSPSVVSTMPEGSLPSTTALTVNGETCPPALAAQWSVDRRMFNGYGPTEATIGAVIWECEPGSDRSPVPIGHPFDGKRIYLLDAWLRLVPPGVAGEVYLAGSGLARGYLNRPALTATRFVADPFRAGERMYRSGDLARRRADGVLEFLGRADDQVKVRGFRIETGEVELALAAVPSVQHCAVTVREDEQGDRMLVGYVQGLDFDGGVARRALLDVLPEYMVPRAFVVVDSFPMTANGKLDKDALPQPRAEVAVRRARNPLEEVLGGLAADVLQVPAVEPDADFFVLGGNSLLATRLVARVRAAVGAEVSLRDFFQAPTVAGLAAVVAEAAGPARAALRRFPRPERIPLSYAQQRLWFLEEWEGPSSAYTIATVVRLGGLVSEDALAGAFEDVLSRHEALRTVFGETHGVPQQRVLGPTEAGEVFTVLRTTPEGAQEQIRRLSDHVFRLDRDAPIRAWLLSSSPTEHALVLVVHHIACDAVSLGPLWGDLSAAYRARLAGMALDLPELPVQYADYAQWQRELLGAEKDPDSLAARELGYWTRKLAGLPPTLALDGARPRPTVTGNRGAEVPLDIGAETHERLALLARSSGATLFMVLHTALAVALTRCGAGTDIVIGAPVAGRTDHKLDRLVGFFVNTLVLRADTSGDPSYRDLLAQVRDADLAAYDHQEMPFERLVEALNPARSAGANPLFQVTLAVDPADEPVPDLPGVTARRDAYESPAARFDLAFGLTVHDEDGRPCGLRGTLLYDTGIYDQPVAQTIADAFSTAVRELAADPDRSITPRDRSGNDAAEGSTSTVGETMGRAPRTLQEETLCGLFTEVLGVPVTGIDDDFFAAGGYSLMAVRLVSRIRSVLGAELSVRQVFESPTVATLAQRLVPGETRPALRRADRPVPVPLSFAQERMWFLAEAEGPSGTYNVPMVASLTGPLDVGALRAALLDVVLRHESLRTVFPSDRGQPYQHVVPEVDADAVLVEQDVPAGAVRAAVAEAVAEAFDLHHELPFRARLLRSSADEHTLVIVMHHVAVDGWSARPLWRDVVTAYEARRSGRPPGWTELPVQYADYALWQRRVLGDAEDGSSPMARHLAYWTRALADLPDQLDLPADRPRTAVPTYTGGCVPVNVSSGAHRALVDLARDTGSTLFMVLQAALAVLLSRMGAGTDIPLGTPVANRTDDALDDSVGLFVNTLVLRTDVSGDPGFRELIERVRSADLEAFDHQELPFERLVEALNPVRSAARHPLFQVMLTLQSGPEPDWSLPGLRVAPYAPDLGVAKFDLGLTATERYEDGEPAGLDAGLEYSADLFSPRAATELADRLSRLLTELTADPDRPVGAAQLIDEHERDTLLESWGRGSGARPADASLIPARVDRQARTRPDAVAAVSSDVVITYAELAGYSDRIGRALAAVHPPETTIALALPPSPWLSVAVVGVLKAGAVFFLLSEGLPEERLSAMTVDAGVTTVLREADVIRLATEEPRTDALPEVDAASAACVFFTSGTTGRPKGAVFVHGELVRYADEMTAVLGLSERDRILQLAEVSFDVVLEELFPALVSGAGVVFAGRNLLSDPEALMSAVVSHGVTGLELTTPFWHEWVDHLHTSGEGLPPSLRFVLIGGERVSVDHVRRWLGLGGVRLVNVYGLTEATVTSTCAEVTADAVERGEVSIGRPLPGVRCYVLDEALGLVPAGVAGELYLAGSGLARGYIGAPGLTAGRFVADPYTPGERMYRTGDLVRWTRDGRLEFLGRSDGQVKLHGFRIELGEVEAALTGTEGVTRCVAAVRETRTGDRVLVAYVVGDGFDAGAARARLAALLPDYMRPSAFVELDGFPLTRTGKLDRQALPMPAAEGGRGTPADAVEAELCEVFAEVLGVDGIGPADDFFRLGGHSLLAIRLISAIRARLGAELSIGALFADPTPAGAARVLLPAVPAARPVARARSGDHLPLSHEQRSLWFLNQMAGSRAAYNVPIVLRLCGHLDPDVLRAALHDVVRRQPSLRTVFPADDGRPYQVVLPAEQSRLDLESGELSEAHLPRFLAEVTAQGFDLTSDLPVRARLLRVGGDAYIFVLLLHHIVTDAWSVSLLQRDISMAYEARLAGAEPAWAELPLSYADYALWQRERWGDPTDPEGPLAQELDYWSDRLAGLPEQLDLPADHTQPTAATYRAGVARFELPPELHGRLAALARETGSTPFAVLQAGFALLLSRLGAGDDIPLGTPVSRRSDEALDELVGFFVNTVVLRTDVSGNPSFRELVTRIRQATSADLDHAGMPFDRLVEHLNPVRSTGHHPLFQVMLTVERADATGWALPGLDVRPVETEMSATKFDLDLSLIEHHDSGGHPAGVIGELHYDRDKFTAGTATAITRRLALLLTDLTDHPDRPVAAARVLDDAERARLLLPAASAAEPAVTGDIPVHELVRERARRTPDAVAITDQDGEVTYAELMALSGLFASGLCEQEGQPDGEEVVAVVMEGSRWLAVAMLGLWTAGRAFLLIDPATPDARLTAMLADAAATTVLRQEQVRTLSAYDGPSVHPTGARTPDGAACVFFTSGTTNRPKGAITVHRELARYTCGMADLLDLRRGDRIVHVASVSFDVVLEEFLPALVSGATTVCVDRTKLADPLAFNREIERLHVTGAHLVTPFWQEWVDSLRAAGRRAPDCLRYLVIFGERVSLDHVQRWRGLADIRLLNSYGLTEATVTTTMGDIGDPAGYEIPLGKPIPGARCYVLDHWLNPVPPGVTGELYVAGTGLARAYIGRPDLTAGRFVANPFTPGARMYRTGDLARWTAEGGIEFAGRADTQAKVRGFRIELGEVEDAMVRVPGVARAVAVVRGEGAARTLVGYVVATGFEPETARRVMGEQLPEYMIPSAFVTVDDFPRTATGKLDRRALPAPSAGTVADAPSSLTECIVAEQFAEVLGRAEVSLRESFFELGGHSLLAVKLLGRLRARINPHIELMDLLAEPTVAAIASRIDLDEAVNTGTLALRPTGTGTPVFCVHPYTGLAWSYAGLLPHIDRERPVYGLQSWYVGKERPPETAEQLVDGYVARIKAVQPDGPYHLLGWSSGGTLAHLIACRLQQQGEEVASLVILDALPGEELRGEDVQGDFEALLGAEDDVRSLLPEGETERLAAAAELTMRLVRATPTPVYRGDAVLVIAGAETTYPVSSKHWRHHVEGGLTERHVFCRHLELIQPSRMAAIADLLSETLD